jgi:hypothetical protein
MRVIALRRSVLTIGFSAFSHNSTVNNPLDLLTQFFLDARSQTNQPFVKKDAGVEPLNYFSLGRLKALLGNPLLSPDWLQVNVGGKATTTHLAAKYALSKRTSLNFAYETVKVNDGGVPTGINSNETNGLKTAMVAGETTKGYGFSISHNF